MALNRDGYRRGRGRRRSPSSPSWSSPSSPSLISWSGDKALSVERVVHHGYTDTHTYRHTPAGDAAFRSGQPFLFGCFCFVFCLPLASTCMVSSWNAHAFVFSRSVVSCVGVFVCVCVLCVWRGGFSVCVVASQSAVDVAVAARERACSWTPSPVWRRHRSRFWTLHKLAKRTHTVYFIPTQLQQPSNSRPHCPVSLHPPHLHPLLPPPPLPRFLHLPPPPQQQQQPLQKKHQQQHYGGTAGAQPRGSKAGGWSPWRGRSGARRCR